MDDYRESIEDITVCPGGLVLDLGTRLRPVPWAGLTCAALTDGGTTLYLWWRMTQAERSDDMKVPGGPYHEDGLCGGFYPGEGYDGSDDDARFLAGERYAAIMAEWRAWAARQVAE